MGIPCTSAGDRRWGRGGEKQVWPCKEDNEQKTSGVEAKRSEGTAAGSELIHPGVEQLCFVILTAPTFTGSPEGRVGLPPAASATIPKLWRRFLPRVR